MNILDRILETKRKEVGLLHDHWDLAELKARAAGCPQPRDFYSAVAKPPRRMTNLIAEVKKASPSAGVIREDFDPATIARQYERGGADALSVLTDVEYFQGSLDYLQQAREAVAIPVLRKDFIIDPFQVYQSRIAGADAILLIAAALSPGLLLDLLILAAKLEMTVLLEVHGADELMQVRSILDSHHAAGCLLGINNRDLTTFEVDIDTTIRLTELVGGETPIVSESGIKTRQDVERLSSAGVRALLVGETLMRHGDPGVGIEELLGPSGPII